MVNNLSRWRVRLCLLLIWILSLSGCVSQSAYLVHPQSGSTVKCGAEGTGLVARLADSLVEDCVRKYKSEGYVAVDELSPQQRADLENRGVLPTREDRPYM